MATELVQIHGLSNSVSLGVRNSGSAVLNFGSEFRGFEIRGGAGNSSCGDRYVSFRNNSTFFDKQTNMPDGGVVTEKMLVPTDAELFKQDASQTTVAAQLLVSEDFKDQSSIGKSATTLKTQFPEIVETNEVGEQSINLIHFIPYLLEMTESQRAELASLRNELHELRSVAVNSNEVPYGMHSATALAGMYLSARPNPTAGIALIDYRIPVTTDFQTAELLLYGANGRQISRRPLGEVAGSQEIDVSRLPNGTYFFSIVVDGQRSEAKTLIVQQ